MDYRSHPELHACVQALFAGEVIAYPTEAVWGLGCDPFNEDAVQKVLQLKCRSADKGLILAAGNMAQIDWLLEGLATEHVKTLEQSWPGHNTWLIPHHQRLPGLVYGQHATIAVRVSEHPVIQALCELFNGPIVSTSANPQTHQPARTLEQAKQYFEQEVVYAPGDVGSEAAPSVIRDLLTGRTLRA